MEDFALLHSILNETHPGLFLHQDSLNLEKKYTECQLKISEATTISAIQYYFQDLLYSIGDFHTTIEPNDILLGVPSKLLPFTITSCSNRYYINKCLTDSTINGLEIEGINSYRMTEIMEALKILIPIDGKRDLIHYTIEVFFSKLYCKYIQQPDYLTVNLIKEGKVIVHPVQLINKSNKHYKYFSEYKFMNEYYDSSPIESFSTPSYAYFRFNSFRNKIDGENFKSYTRKFFSDLTDNQSLIIDLRHNSGGKATLPAYINSFVTESSFQTFNSISTKVSHINKNTYITNKRDVARSLRHLKENGNTYEKTKNANLKLIKPLKNTFKGKIYVLTSSMTASAATMLCSFLKRRDDVVFVGEETSGAIDQFCAHNHLKIKLPNSNWNVTIPLQLLEIGKPQTTYGTPLIPDIELHQKIEDYQNNRDTVLEHVIAMINEE